MHCVDQLARERELGSAQWHERKRIEAYNCFAHTPKTWIHSLFINNNFHEFINKSAASEYGMFFIKSYSRLQKRTKNTCNTLGTIVHRPFLLDSVECKKW